MNKFINKIIQGDCLEVMKEIPDNSVDSIVTDPPYELGFMNKAWDKTGIANNVSMWAECLRVLKPGGHLLAFSGTRTYHRMAVAIEDAGFEVRDMIEWVYGCLSEDTEILTESGYKPLHKLTQYDRIGVYDIANNIYKWERPQRYSVYKVHQDTAYRIKSDYTDQIVSRNHRCLVEREGKLVFVEAWQLNEVEYMPTLSDDFYSLQENPNRKLLLKGLLWKGKGLAQTVFSKWKGNKKSEERVEVRKEPSLERWSNLLEETRKLQADKICEVSEGVFSDGEKRWICNGTSFDNGSILGDMFRENPSSSSYQSRPTGQPTGKPDVISIKQGTQITRRARVTKIEYSGIIFCPTVSTGAFVARRNGQVFITGNSGFPKSLNIGKAVDKLQGNEREVIGENPYNARRPNGNSWADAGINGKNETELTKGTSEWEGWGTATKPAHEPIAFCSKPLTVELVFAKMGIDITNNLLNLCEKYNVNVKDAESSLKSIHLKLEKAVVNTVAENARTCDWENIENAVIVALNFMSPKHTLKEKTEEIKEVSAQINAKENGNSDSREKTTQTGKAENLREQMAILQNMLATEAIGLNTILLWKQVLEGVLEKAKMSTISTALEMTTGLKICNSLLKANTQNYTRANEIRPNHEPICMARKPLAEKTVAENCLRWKTGGINIDESRVETSDKYSYPNGAGGNSFSVGEEPDGKRTEPVESNNLGRFPANLLHDNSEEVRGCFPETQGKWGKHVFGKKYMGRGDAEIQEPRRDSGNASRFFKSIIYKSKASKRDRGIGNNHPTVKSVALMEYLIKMVTPKGGIVLDPFFGSGTTGVACINFNYSFIGIELNADYVKIAKSRLTQRDTNNKENVCKEV